MLRWPAFLTASIVTTIHSSLYRYIYTLFMRQCSLQEVHSLVKIMYGKNLHVYIAHNTDIHTHTHTHTYTKFFNVRVYTCTGWCVHALNTTRVGQEGCFRLANRLYSGRGLMVQKMWLIWCRCSWARAREEIQLVPHQGIQLACSRDKHDGTSSTMDQHILNGMLK